MQVEIIKSKCQAYGNCADEAPEVFRLDDSGYAELVHEGQVPPGQQAEARTGALSCPAQAIILRD